MLQYIKSIAPGKLLLATLVLSVLSYFIQKPLPSVFLGMRLLGFVLLMMAVYRWMNRK